MSSSLCVVSSGGDGSCHVWEISSGACVAMYAESMASYRSTALIPPPSLTREADYMVSAQIGKPALLVHTWAKEAPLYRCPVPHPILAVASSPDGVYAAAGSSQGQVYIWAVASGELLRSWNAHYKAVSALVFSPCGSALVSGGQDGIIHVWDVATCIDVAALTDVSLAPAPAITWTDHSLPVSSLRFGPGLGLAAKLVSASSDRTVRVWEISTRRALHSITMPAAVNAACMDDVEHTLYAGCVDGNVYAVPLFASLMSAAAPDAQLGVAAGGSAMGFFTPAAGSATAPDSSTAVSYAPAREQQRVLSGHTASVSDIVLAGGGMLVSASDDTTLRVWDVATAQVLYIYEGHKGPVASAQVLPKPSALLRTGKHASAPSTPLAPFKKFSLPIAPQWRGVTSGDPTLLTPVALPCGAPSLAEVDDLNVGMRQALLSFAAAGFGVPSSSPSTLEDADEAMGEEEGAAQAPAVSAEELQTLREELDAAKARVAVLESENARWKAVGNKLMAKTKGAPTAAPAPAPAPAAEVPAPAAGTKRSRR